MIEPTRSRLLQLLTFFTICALWLGGCGQAPDPDATGVPSLVPSLTLAQTPGTAPTSSAVLQSSPEATAAEDIYTAWDGSFSLEVPAGWQVKDLGLKYLSLEGPLVANRSAKLDFVSGETAQPPGEYASYAQEQLRQQLPELTEVDEHFQDTAAGSGYLRWEIEYNRFNEDIHQVFYFFELGDQVLTVIFTRLVEMGTESDVLIDEAIQTLSFGEDP